MKKSTAMGMALLGLCLGTLLIPAASAQVLDPVMQICGGQSTTVCTDATGALDIGSTSNSNPTFAVAVNGGQTNVEVALVVLVPSNSTLSNLGFSATFTNGTSTVNMNVASPSGGSTPFQSNQELLSYLGVSCTGTQCNNSGTDYHFNSINAVQSVAGVTGYSAYYLTPGSTITTNSQGKGPFVTVSFSNFINGSAFPVGTIFLAFGIDDNPLSPTYGDIVYKTPLTVGEEITAVPEYGSLSMMFFSAAVMLGAMIVRRRSALGTA